MTVRTLVVDDSPTMRAIVTSILSTDDEIEVVGTAGSPHSARTLIRQLDPDVVTLDVDMPDMNGLDFLDRIMRLRPMPVVMLSSLTQRGAETTLRALELGAFDCLGKPKTGLQKAPGYRDELVDMVKAAARSNRRRPAARSAATSQPADDYRPRENALIAIGASTGGVEALIELLAGFPAMCPPTVIVQHMPESFTTTFAARLDRLSRPRVSEARHGEALLRGHVYLAPGGLRHMEVAGTGTWRCRLIEGERSSGHRPSVDRLFHSVAARAGKAAVAALLTGMGADGAAGLKAMRDAGATTLGQDRESCVVYGMPAAAHAMGAVTAQLPLSRIAPRLLAECAA
jgi:two-component system chemotaxis response regulator CheB